MTTALARGIGHTHDANNDNETAAINLGNPRIFLPPFERQPKAQEREISKSCAMLPPLREKCKQKIRRESQRSQAEHLCFSAGERWVHREATKTRREDRD